MKIGKDNIEQLVADTLGTVVKQVEEQGFPLSSEKTLVFKFMWELGRIVSDDDLKFDFEYAAYEKLNSSDTSDRFLDLLVWTDEDFKVAFEFKLPKRGLTGSPQTNTKPKIYRDIARLKYLVDTAQTGIRAGFFICAVNEDAYLNNTGRADLTYSVAHMHKASVTEVGGLSLPTPLTFIWNGIKLEDYKDKYVCAGRFAWLEPVIIHGG